MKEIDWSKAPDWANVVICAELGAHFWASSWGGQKLAQNIQTGATRYATMYGDHCWHLVASRNDGGWNGEGLPPVGTVIEWLDGEWLQVVVVGNHKGAVVAVDEDDPRRVFIGKKPCYRPFRTPEQIAAEEREKAVSQMAVIALAGDHQLITKVYLERLYDAGYRRVEQ